MPSGRPGPTETGPRPLGTRAASPAAGVDPSTVIHLPLQAMVPGGALSFSAERSNRCRRSVAFERRKVPSRWIRGEMTS